MICVHCSRYTSPWSATVLDQYAASVSFDSHLKVNHYHRWQDTQAHVLGRLLLVEGLKALGIDRSMIPPLRYTDNQRPYFDLDVDFSIAHSGEYVLCAVSDRLSIGVDIERIRLIALADMQPSFLEKEWEEIMKSRNPHRQMFNYWTRKEAVAKADGRGMSVAQEIMLSDGTARLENAIWHLYPLAIDDEYCAYVAASEAVSTNIELTNFRF